MQIYSEITLNMLCVDFSICARTGIQAESSKKLYHGNIYFMCLNVFFFLKKEKGIIRRGYLLLISISTSVMSNIF